MFLRVRPTHLLSNRYKMPSPAGIRYYIISSRIAHNTPLHELILNSSHPKEIHAFINKNRDEVEIMARTVNDQGEIPLDLISKTELKENDQKEIRSTLIEMLKNQKIKPLSKELCIDDIIKNDYPNLDKEWGENLDLACTTVNEIRKIVHFSGTHPDMNHFDMIKQSQIRCLIHQLRSSVIYNDPESIFSVCQNYGVGNCGDMSFAAIHVLKTKAKKKLHLNVLEVKNGDHVFVVFGSNPLRNANHYYLRQTKNVFLDPWSGTVGKFFHTDLEKKLGDYRQYFFSENWATKSLNVVTTFNPNYHYLATISSFLSSKKSSPTMGLGLFDKVKTSMSSTFSTQREPTSQQEKPQLGRNW